MSAGADGGRAMNTPTSHTSSMVRRHVYAFMPGIAPRTAVALDGKCVEIEWDASMTAHCIRLTPAQARAVAARLVAVADEIEGTAKLDVEIAATFAQWLVSMKKGTP